MTMISLRQDEPVHKRKPFSSFLIKIVLAVLLLVTGQSRLLQAQFQNDPYRDIIMYLISLQREPLKSDELIFVGEDTKSMNVYRSLLVRIDEWTQRLQDPDLSDTDWIDTHLCLYKLRAQQFRYERILQLLIQPDLYLPTADFFQDQETFSSQLQTARDALAMANDRLMVCSQEQRDRFNARGEAVVDSLIEAATSLDLSDSELDQLGAYLEQLQAYVDVVQSRAVTDEELQSRLKEQRYHMKVKYEHGLDLSPDDIIALGQKHLDRAHLRLQELADTLQPGQTWFQVNESIKNDTVDDLVESYTAFSDEVIEFVYSNKLFRHYPEAENYVVRLGSSSGAGQFPFGFYRQPRRPSGNGAFIVVPAPENWPEEKKRERLRDSCRSFLQIVAPHEGIPGHHYQFSVALLQKHSSIRRMFFTPVYSEGWGLYCEHLLEEQGFFDLQAQFCQMRMHAWRCARAIVDPSLHLGRMTKEEAIQFLIANVGFSRTTAESEVNRFLNSPTQPMSYLVGMLQIMDLRTRYQAIKKQNFDFLEFHDRFLSFGAIPIHLVRTVMLGERQGQ